MIPLPRPVAGLVPHAGSMCLLDQVIECGDDHIVCSAVSHRSPNNPLRDAGRLSVSAAIGFIALFGQAVLNGVVMVTRGSIF